MLTDADAKCTLSALEKWRYKSFKLRTDEEVTPVRLLKYPSSNAPSVRILMMMIDGIPSFGAALERRRVKLFKLRTDKGGHAGEGLCCCLSTLHLHTFKKTRRKPHRGIRLEV